MQVSRDQNLPPHSEAQLARLTTDCSLFTSDSTIACYSDVRSLQGGCCYVRFAFRTAGERGPIRSTFLRFRRHTGCIIQDQEPRPRAMGQCFGRYGCFTARLWQRSMSCVRDRAAARKLWCGVCSDKNKANSGSDSVPQNPSVHGHQAGNPLGRMSMGKPTEDQLDRASVVKVAQ